MTSDVKSINIKNHTYYFFNDMINTKYFDSSLSEIDKTSYKNIYIYYIRYITIKKIDDYNDLHSATPLYLIVNTADGHIEEKMEINTSFDSSGEKVLSKYTEFLKGIKSLIGKIDAKPNEYAKDFMKIRFESNL